MWPDDYDPDLDVGTMTIPRMIGLFLVGAAMWVGIAWCIGAACSAVQASAYETMGARWHTQVRIYAPPELAGIAAEALYLWTGYAGSGLDAVLVTDTSAANVVIGYAHTTNSPSLILSANTQMVDIDPSGIRFVRIDFDQRLSAAEAGWSYDYAWDIWVRTMTHEMGHAFGLLHSHVPGGIMNEYNVGHWSEDDRTGILSLYPQ